MVNSFRFSLYGKFGSPVLVMPEKRTMRVWKTHSRASRIIRSATETKKKKEINRLSHHVFCVLGSLDWHTPAPWPGLSLSLGLASLSPRILLVSPHSPLPDVTPLQTSLLQLQTCRACSHARCCVRRSHASPLQRHAPVHGITNCACTVCLLVRPIVVCLFHIEVNYFFPWPLYLYYYICY